MRSNAAAGTRRSVLLTLFTLALIGGISVVPSFLRSAAVSRPVSEDAATPADGFANYDIRLDKKAAQKLAAFRASAGTSAATVADMRERFVQAEESLKAAVPTLKLEYSRELGWPEIIAPDVKLGKAFLTTSSGEKRSDILINFLKENNELLGASVRQIDGLKVFADYTNPDGNLSFVELNQEIDGIPVFRGEVRAGFTKNGELIRVINNLAPGLDGANISTKFGDPADALTAAADHIDLPAADAKSAFNKSASSELKSVFGTGDWATTAEKMYFPTEPGVAVPAWRVLFWLEGDDYYVIVDAETGTMLWRKNITESQTEPATYYVYKNPNAMIKLADNPAPLASGPPTRNGAQGAAISRSFDTRIGNEGDYSFNALGWIDDGNNATDGNNVQAGLDRESPNSNSPANPNDIDPNGMPIGFPLRDFSYPMNPGIPSNPKVDNGDAPLPAGQNPGLCQTVGTNATPTSFQMASATQLFYATNLFHDELYTLGFTEEARNFQNNNFGRGGAQLDRISAQAQDCSGANNANFSTPADGTRAQMQMYLWTAPNPDFDGSLDSQVVLHELAHGVSNRLHSNASGLTTDMARAMGEGWSDFYALSLLSEPSDPVNGLYAFATYDTFFMQGVILNNHYYGIRRFPKAIMSATGGDQNRPFNPLTFADIDQTKINLTNGAFPAMAANHISGTADQVHNAGEVWSSALWEVRARYIQRLGWAVGNRRILQFVTDGMKLNQGNPTFLSERDAILTAALAGGTAADVADIWAGFAVRGLGASASIQYAGEITIGGSGTGATRVTEAFDLPNLIQTPSFSVTDEPGDNDGFAEPGETVNLRLPVSNFSGTNATGVTVQIVGGGSANYGTIANGSAVTQPIQFTIPQATPCGGVVTVTFTINSSIGPQVTLERTISIGQPVITFSENFDNESNGFLPPLWTRTSVQGGINWVTATGQNPDSGQNTVFAFEPSTVGGGTDLTSPLIPIGAQAATVTFSNRYNTEDEFDGGVLELSIASGAYQDILVAGGSFLGGGYTGQIRPNADNNPLAGRNAWEGTSGGNTTTVVRLPAAASGQNIQLRWRFGSDDSVAPANGGWNIDTVRVAGSYNCSFNPPTSGNSARFDFDGDGTSDISIFRPSNQIWFLLRSTAGFTGYQWGLAGDKMTPADFDGDGTTDVAVWRPSDGKWYVIYSDDFTISATGWGLNGDTPVPGDFDGDGTDDLAVFRPSENKWYVRHSGGTFSTTTFGLSGDLPITGDFDGDGRSDFVVFRPSDQNWFLLRTTAGFTGYKWGLPGDKTVPADYDGDGKMDVAVWRPSNGRWYIIYANLTLAEVGWGLNGDVPAPADYNGDGKEDFAVFRPSEAKWYIRQSGSGIREVSFGLTGDIPTQSAFVH